MNEYMEQIRDIVDITESKYWIFTGIKFDKYGTTIYFETTDLGYGSFTHIKRHPLVGQVYPESSIWSDVATIRVWVPGLD